MLAALLVALFLVVKFIRGRSDRESIFGLGSGTRDIEKHTLEANKYVSLFAKGSQVCPDPLPNAASLTMTNFVQDKDRLANYETVVNSYYDLATDFYEYGWVCLFFFSCVFGWSFFSLYDRVRRSTLLSARRRRRSLHPFLATSTFWPPSLGKEGDAEFFCII